MQDLRKGFGKILVSLKADFYFVPALESINFVYTFFSLVSRKAQAHKRLMVISGTNFIFIKQEN